MGWILFLTELPFDFDLNITVLPISSLDCNYTIMIVTCLNKDLVYTYLHSVLTSHIYTVSSYILSFYKVDTSLKWTLETGPNIMVSTLKRVNCTSHSLG